MRLFERVSNTNQLVSGIFHIYVSGSISADHCITNTIFPSERFVVFQRGNTHGPVHQNDIKCTYFLVTKIQHLLVLK